MASCHSWGFSGKPSTLHLSLQWNNPTLAVLLTPACLTGAKPTAFPKCQRGCRKSRPLPEVGLVSVSQRTPGTSFWVSLNLPEVTVPVRQVETKAPRSKAAAAPGAGGADVHFGANCSQSLAFL